MSRKNISKKDRFEVFKRDSFSCQYCGDTPPTVVLEVDHIHPVSKGGDNCIDNLITACFDCNRGKSNKLLSAIPKSVKERLRIEEEIELQLSGLKKIRSAKKRRETLDVNSVDKLFQSYFDGSSLNNRFKTSIKLSFLPSLDINEIKDSMDLACSKISDPESAIKYFCGICWNKIRSKEE